MQQRLFLLAAGSIALMGAAGPSRPTACLHPVTLKKAGESACACVLASLHWNHTCIRLESGGEYVITAKGTWWDASHEHGPHGGPSDTRILKMTERFRRLPHQDWFKLICALDWQKKTAFPYDTFDAEHPYKAPADGELTCFANDVWLFYFNNTGVVQITVERIR